MSSAGRAGVWKKIATEYRVVIVSSFAFQTAAFCVPLNKTRVPLTFESMVRLPIWKQISWAKCRILAKPERNERREISDGEQQRLPEANVE